MRSTVRRTSVVVNESRSTYLPTTNRNGGRTSASVVTSVFSKDQPTSILDNNSKPAGAKGGGGLSVSDKIALGVGLGIGGATLIVSIMTCLKCYEPLRSAVKRRIFSKGL